MRKPALLVLVRHAESARNRAKQHTTYFADDAARRTVRGIPDHEIPLTTEGYEQARQTGVALRERFGAFDYVYTSGYARTDQTLDGILEAYNEAEVKKMQRRRNIWIRERDPGHTYDMTEEQVALVFPWLAEYWATFGGFMARPPGGESLADVAQRVQMFLDKINHDRAGQRVLVVTHGGTLRGFRYNIEHWSYEQALRWPEGQSPINCGTTVYQADEAGEHLELVEYNTQYWTVGSAEDGE